MDRSVVCSTEPPLRYVTVAALAITLPQHSQSSQAATVAAASGELMLMLRHRRSGEHWAGRVPPTRLLAPGTPVASDTPAFLTCAFASIGNDEDGDPSPTLSVELLRFGSSSQPAVLLKAESYVVS